MKKLELDDRLEKAAYELRMTRGELMDRWLKMEEENGCQTERDEDEQKQNASEKIEALEARLAEVEKNYHTCFRSEEY